MIFSKLGSFEDCGLEEARTVVGRNRAWRRNVTKFA